MRVVTWNMHGAGVSRQSAWELLKELEPDIALLQEVGEIPLDVATEFACREAHAIRRNGHPQRFKTVTLVRGRIAGELEIPAPEHWIGVELRRFAGNLVSLRLQPAAGRTLNVINVYNPAWPVERSGLQGIDTSTVRLTQQARDVWLSDLLCSSLKALLDRHSEPWIVAGDFNLCESFDEWPGGPRGNREYLDRMAALGFVECLRQCAGKIVPTFKKPDGGAVACQIDHVFVNEPLVAGLRSATTGSRERVFGENLSDHLPVIADFEFV